MKYYQSNTRMYPVKVREDGSVVLCDPRNGKALEQQTKSISSKFGGNTEAILSICKDSPARDLKEFSVWARKIETARAKKMQAEVDLQSANMELKKLENRVKDYSYAETKAMGCIAQVDWDGETLENPKTGNEFFTPEDAKAILDSLYEQHREEIEKQRKEWWGGPKEYPISFDDYFRMSNNVCEDASEFLDDLIAEEEDDEWEPSMDFSQDYWLRRTSEFQEFHSRKKGGFLLAVLNYYLEGSGNPCVEQFEVKVSGMFNGTHKEYAITGNDKGGFELARTDKERGE